MSDSPADRRTPDRPRRFGSGEAESQTFCLTSSGLGARTLQMQVGSPTAVPDLPLRTQNVREAWPSTQHERSRRVHNGSRHWSLNRLPDRGRPVFFRSIPRVPRPVDQTMEPEGNSLRILCQRGLMAFSARSCHGFSLGFDTQAEYWDHSLLHFHLFGGYYQGRIQI